MHPRTRTLQRSLASAGACVLVASILHVTPHVAAQPATTRGEVRGDTAMNAVNAPLGTDIVSLETSAPSIPQGTPFTFRARATLRSDADQLWMRFRVRRPSGRLLFQRTRIVNAPEAGYALESFTRETADLDLKPGVHPVDLEVAVTRGGTTDRRTVSTELMVYDASLRPMRVALVARVGGQPLSDPNGRLVADPERFTRARDGVRTVASWVLTRPQAHLTLAVSPLLLEEWRRIADGYELAGPEGVETIPSDSAVARDHASTLDLLRRATETGRLEIAAVGYSDPDLLNLAVAGLTEDTTEQYERGLSAIFTSLETTPSTGTVPAGGCIPAQAPGHLDDAGVGYAVLEASCVRTGDETPSAGSYRSKGASLAVLVSDPEMGALVTANDGAKVVSRAFARAIDASAAGPLVIAVDLSTGETDAEALIDAAEALSGNRWLELLCARDCVGRPRRTVRVVAGPQASAAPEGYWNEVREGRARANALAAAVGSTEPDAVTALRASFIAESSAWAGPDGRWATADRGLAFTATAVRLANDVLDGLTLALEPITLSGSHGKVPVTVRNATDRTLAVTLRATANDGAILEGPTEQAITLDPRDTFIEVPVDLSRSPSGRLLVEVLAADHVIASREVRITASYLDRVVVVGGIVLLLGILLAFIIRRVRTAEGGEDEPLNPNGRERSSP